MTAAASSVRASAASHRELLRLAAIDVGTNSIHMIVAQIDADGAVTTLWRMKEPVGLGRLSFPNKTLTAAAMEPAAAALSRFQHAAVQRGAEKIIAVATSAIREAANGGDLIERFRRDAKTTVRVISARDEARLIYLAVRHAYPLRQIPALIIDVGGGSVEFVVGDGKKASMLESRKLGAARMTSRFVNSDPISKEDLQKLRKHYDAELSPLYKQIEPLRPSFAIGTSGTLENIAAMAAEFSPNGIQTPAVIERRAFDKLLHTLIKSDSKQRGRMKGLDEQRRDQIVAGAVLVGRLFENLKLKKITICHAALREGLILDYLSKHIPDLQIRRDVPDPRRRAVLDLARRCDWHQNHSEHVTMLCLKLFDELKTLHGLGTLEREVIEFGSLLHDIGWHISGKGHHRHSMYLIEHGDLSPFTREEVAIMSNIARYHRKDPPTKEHEQYAALPLRSRRVVDVGSALLRLADGLDRTHASVVQNLKCKIGEKKVQVVIDTRADAQLEMWGAKRKSDYFGSVFGKKLEIAIK